MTVFYAEKNCTFCFQIPGHDPIPGYLSLHLNHRGLTLKWTPNQLMNGYDNNTKVEGNETETNNPTDSPKKYR